MRCLNKWCSVRAVLRVWAYINCNILQFIEFWICTRICTMSTSIDGWQFTVDGVGALACDTDGTAGPALCTPSSAPIKSPQPSPSDPAASQAAYVDGLNKGEMGFQFNFFGGVWYLHVQSAFSVFLVSMQLRVIFLEGFSTHSFITPRRRVVTFPRHHVHCVRSAAACSLAV